MDKLFKLVFHNIVLFKIIFKYVKLYNKNKIVLFKSLKTLKQYSEKSYIQKLIFQCCDVLEQGDLPENGVLKELILKDNGNLIISKNAIPISVEIIQFNSINSFYASATKYSKLPTTINSIKNASVPLNIKSKGEMEVIPLNITSISFNSYNFSISSSFHNGQEISYLKIPNSIKTLSFQKYWDNITPLTKGDIPNSVTSLNLGRYSPWYLNSDILSNNIKEIKMDINITSEIEKKSNAFKFLDQLPNVETFQLNFGLSFLSEILLFNNNNSIESTFLTTIILTGIEFQFNNGFLPCNVKNLTLNFADKSSKSLKRYNIPVLPRSIPTSVESLSINKLIVETNVFPNSLKTLDVSDIIDYLDNKKIKKMMLVLPKSVTSIKLPDFCEYLPDIYNGKAIPKNITQIIYKKIKIKSKQDKHD